MKTLAKIFCLSLAVLAGSVGTSWSDNDNYLEASRYLHIFKGLPGLELNHESLTYYHEESDRTVHLGFYPTYEDILPELESKDFYKRIFPLKEGKKFEYKIYGRGHEWLISLKVISENTFIDPTLGQIYCFDLEGETDNIYGSYNREIKIKDFCPVYGFSKYLIRKGGNKGEIFFKAISSKASAVFRVELRGSKISYLTPHSRLEKTPKAKVALTLRKNVSVKRYWAGYKTNGYIEDEADQEWKIKIQYSEDGLRYKAHVYFEKNGEEGRGAGPCEGEVDAKGKLEFVECDLYDFSTRSLGGTVTNLELFNTGGGSSGGAEWVDKTLQKIKIAWNSGERERQELLALKQIKAEQQQQAALALQKAKVEKKRMAELARKKKEAKQRDGTRLRRMTLKKVKVIEQERRLKWLEAKRRIQDIRHRLTLGNVQGQNIKQQHKTTALKARQFQAERQRKLAEAAQRVKDVRHKLENAIARRLKEEHKGGVEVVAAKRKKAERWQEFLDKVQLPTKMEVKPGQVSFEIPLAYLKKAFPQEKKQTQP